MKLIPFAAADWLGPLISALGGGGTAAGILKLAQWWKSYRTESAKLRSKMKQEDMTVAERKDRVALDEWKEVVAHLHQTVEKLETAEAAARERELKCQQQNTRHQNAIVYLHGVACHQNAIMRDKGWTAEIIRPLSDFIPEDRRAEENGRIEEGRRNMAQATVLVKAEARKMVSDAGHRSDAGAAGEVAP